MSEDLETIISSQSANLNSNATRDSIFMGGVLVFLNLFLMSCVGIYWTNPAIHQYFSGKPL